MSSHVIVVCQANELRHLAVVARRSSLVAWTTATHCCTASMTGYFAACSLYRMLQHALVTGVRRCDCHGFSQVTEPWLYHTTVAATAVATSSSASHFQGRGARSRWVAPAYVPRWRLSDVSRRTFPSNVIRTWIVPRTRRQKLFTCRYPFVEWIATQLADKSASHYI